MYKIPSRTLFLGHRLIYMPQCHSTNEIAAQILHQSSPPEGTVVITDRQLQGKGQRGNTWITEDFRNLTFSVILKPAFLLPRNQFYLNVVAALGVQQAVSSLLKVPVFVKWPNDIMTGGGKLAGILIENQLQGQLITHSIVGIGLNVNQLKFSIPTATSMAIEADARFDLNEMLETLLVNMEKYYLQLRQGAMDTLRKSYEACLYWKDEVRTYSAGDEVFQGRILGVNAAGELEIDSGGRRRSFGIKQVGYVR